MSKKKTSVSSKQTQNNLFLTILACAVLIIGASSILLLKSNEQPKAQVVMEKNYITVENQLAGSKVTVKKVVVDQPSFVLVRLDDEGQPGKVIGISKFVADDIENLEITLYQKTLTGQKLTAELRTDDGSKKFNVQKDLETKDSLGNTVFSPFTIN